MTKTVDILNYWNQLYESVCHKSDTDYLIVGLQLVMSEWVMTD